MYDGIKAGTWTGHMLDVAQMQAVLAEETANGHRLQETLRGLAAAAPQRR